MALVATAVLEEHFDAALNPLPGFAPSGPALGDVPTADKGDAATDVDGSTESGGDDLEAGREDEVGESARAFRFSVADTLVILDWDDTLCPTTWIHQEAATPQGTFEVTKEQEARLHKVADSAAALVEAAKLLGRVVLVTNAEKGWIEWSSSRFLPGLFATLEGVSKISARDEFGRGAMEDYPSEWKRIAFEREVRSFSGQSAGGEMQVFSIGDSVYDHIALHRASQSAYLPPFFPKSVKLMEEPTPEQLVQQHAHIVSSLGDMSEHNGRLDVDVALKAFDM